MSESADTPADTLFRPNKRRKVFRKRNLEDEYEESVIEDRLPGESSTNETGDKAQDSIDRTTVVRRPNVKKHGIGFRSSAKDYEAKDAANSETALVPHHSQERVAIEGDRFVKPMGKAEVVEDKHLTAFLDSKLAELRSSGAPSTHVSSSSDAFQESFPPPAIQTETGSKFEPQPPLSNAARNKDYLTRAQRKEQKALRRVPKRDADDVVRDDMIDQILRESHVPMYDQAPAKEPTYSDSDVDNDEAAARAFKAEFLAQTEANNRRKPPAPPAAKGAVPVSTGPKLGGSRSMREKMKALEAEKNKPGSKR